MKNATESILKSKSNISCEECQLKFMKEVVKIHGTNGDILKATIEAITRFENKDFNFKRKLLKELLIK